MSTKFANSTALNAMQITLFFCLVLTLSVRSRC
ncbi:hypothetical protein AB3F25_08060 [Aggregatibacter sp. HMT-949]